MAQNSKFDRVVSSLPPTVAALVRYIIRSPPDEEAYDKLREELILCTTESVQRRLRQLLPSEELNDCKPSEFLR